MSECHDIVVIGAGIAGVSAALHLQQRGREVLLIDRREPGRETSYGNAGVIGTGYVLPFGFPPLKKIPRILLDRDTAARADLASLPRFMPWLIDFYFKSQPAPRRRSGEQLYPLIRNAVAEHRHLMQKTGAEEHLTIGRQTTLYRTEAGFDGDAGIRAIAAAMNVPFEILDCAAYRALEPHLKPAFHKVVRWPGSGHVNNPGALITALAERFVREGGALLKTKVRAITPEKYWVVETAENRIIAQNIVICTGPWANGLLKPLGYHFPLVPKRGYHQHYRADGGASLSHVITDAEYGYVIAPMQQGYRLTTGAEFTDMNNPPTPVQLGRILPIARELFPFGEAVDPAPWYGHRPCFADSLPVIGQVARHAGLWLNFGHGHNGLTIGPSTGRLLAEIMCGEKPFTDPQPYRAGRFGK